MSVQFNPICFATMNAALVILLACLALSTLGFGIFHPSSTPAVQRTCKALAIICLFVLAWFSASEYLGAFDSSLLFDRLRWRMEYAALGVGSLFGAAQIVLHPRQLARPATEKAPVRWPRSRDRRRNVRTHRMTVRRVIFN